MIINLNIEIYVIIIVLMIHIVYLKLEIHVQTIYQKIFTLILKIKYIKNVILLVKNAINQEMIRIIIVMNVNIIIHLYLNHL